MSEIELVRCVETTDGKWIAEARFTDSPVYPPTQLFGVEENDKYEALWQLAQFLGTGEFVLIGGAIRINV